MLNIQQPNKNRKTSSETRVHVLEVEVETSQTPALSFWMCCYANRVLFGLRQQYSECMWVSAIGSVYVCAAVTVYDYIYVRLCTRPQCINQNTHYWAINKVRIGCYFKYWTRGWRRFEDEKVSSRSKAKARPTKSKFMPRTRQILCHIFCSIACRCSSNSFSSFSYDVCASRWLHKNSLNANTPSTGAISNKHSSSNNSISS